MQRSEHSNQNNLLDLSRILCTATETMRAVSWMSGMSSARPSDSSSSVNCRDFDEPFTLIFPPLQMYVLNLMSNTGQYNTQQATQCKRIYFTEA